MKKFSILSIVLSVLFLNGCIIIVGNPGVGDDTNNTRLTEQESNDSWSLANSLSWGQTIFASLANTDVDWFEINLTKGETYVITTGNDSLDITNIDTVLSLIDTDTTTTIASNDDFNGSDAFSSITNLITNTAAFYLRTALFDSSTGGAYSLWVTNIDSRDYAQPMVLAPFSYSNQFNFFRSGDVDYYSFTDSGTETYIIILSNVTGTMDIDFRIYNGSGNMLRNVDSSQGSGETNYFVATNTGTYYLEVFDYNNTTGSYFIDFYY